MSSLGYGLRSWGLLNVVFLLSMFYPRRDTTAKRRYEHPRAAWRGLFDRNARTGQPLRAHQRRRRTDCDRPARSSHAPPRRSRTGRRRGIAGVCGSLALHPVGRREPRLRSPGRRPSSCTPVLGPRRRARTQDERAHRHATRCLGAGRAAGDAGERHGAAQPGSPTTVRRVTAMAAGYDSSTATPRLRSGPNGMPPRHVRNIQRGRILAAAVVTVEELGYARMTVAQVIARARRGRALLVTPAQGLGRCSDGAA